jgi:GxxExxY protein
MKENEITELIIGCAIKIHRSLGPGLLESAYEACLFYELSKIGLTVEKQKALPLIYESVKLDCGYRADFVIENKVVIEVKSVDAIADIHLAQILTYLKLSNCKVGLLINFNVLKLTDGLKRVVNKYNDSAALSESSANSAVKKTILQ